jgi:hypothetical protein
MGGRNVSVLSPAVTQAAKFPIRPRAQREVGEKCAHDETKQNRYAASVPCHISPKVPFHRYHELNAINMGEMMCGIDKSQC